MNIKSVIHFNSIMSSRVKNSDFPMETIREERFGRNDKRIATCNARNMMQRRKLKKLKNKNGKNGDRYYKPSRNKMSRIKFLER